MRLTVKSCSPPDLHFSVHNNFFNMASKEELLQSPAVEDVVGHDIEKINHGNINVSQDRKDIMNMLMKKHNGNRWKNIAFVLWFIALLPRFTAIVIFYATWVILMLTIVEIITIIVIINGIVKYSLDVAIFGAVFIAIHFAIYSPFIFMVHPYNSYITLSWISIGWLSVLFIVQLFYAEKVCITPAPSSLYLSKL